jgi:CBS domain-containing protein
VVASPGDDIITVTTRMADFNLLSLPVVDASNKMLGIVTVDDALEAAIHGIGYGVGPDRITEPILPSSTVMRPMERKHPRLEPGRGNEPAFE